MYTALESSRQQIRLPRVIPKDQNNAQIRCEIVTAQLQVSIPKFAALSYVWGDAADTEEIVVDGQPFQATRSLNSALQQFRASYTRNGCKSLFLWADAVCINQQGLVETDLEILSENTAFYKKDTELSSGKKAWNAIDEPNHHAY
ncbi:HET-domain-containing protein [Apiospora arundinis]|uniref:HET-domain-containing protein n=1 Tax=Apiospora arundinis TaxID=335852 RepID=A0ABR2IHH0_9PEZI